MEQQDLLDPLNEWHLFMIQYVFLPRINRSLKKFQDAWNHHSLRMEGNSTPHQLFISGILTLRNAGMIALDFLEDINDRYDINSGHLTVDHDEDENIIVPLD